MQIKPIIWVASTKSDLISLPDEVQDEIGHALYQAQKGEKSDKAKPFKGFGSAAVLEIVESDSGGTVAMGGELALEVSSDETGKKQ